MRARSRVKAFKNTKLNTKTKNNRQRSARIESPYGEKIHFLEFAALGANTSLRSSVERSLQDHSYVIQIRAGFRGRQSGHLPSVLHIHEP